MKKLAVISTIIILAILAGIIGIRVKEPDGNYRKNVTRVGILLNGSRDDRGWNEAHVSALESVKEELNLEIIYKENVPYGEEAAACIEELIGDGARIIIAESIGYEAEVRKAAKDHPKIYFYHCSGTESGTNFSTFFARMYQVRYLSGIAAGYATETGSIAYVAAYDIPEVIRGIDAFTLGVRSVNPTAVVHVSYTGSWDDYDGSYRAAEDLVKKYGCDVVTHHTDTISPMDAARDLKVRSIGYDYDNRANYPDSMIAACCFNWETFYRDEIRACLEGRFYGKHVWLGMEDGAVDLTPLTVNAGPKKDTAERIIAQKTVEMENGRWDVFFGPVKDAEGDPMIRQAEAASDIYLLDDLTWYVQGVSLHD